VWKKLKPNKKRKQSRWRSLKYMSSSEKPAKCKSLKLYLPYAEVKEKSLLR
jgi:Pyruvate/2-oxoacid:ferredoxin oxidoreductase delta subunit